MNTSCHDCGVDALPTEGGDRAEYYIVHDALWVQAGMISLPARKFVCIGCLELRLGRQLLPGDFADVLINDPAIRADTASFAWSYFWGHSLSVADPAQGRLNPSPRLGRLCINR